MTRIRISKDEPGAEKRIDEARSEYEVFQEDSRSIILEVPEDQAENIVRRSGGLIEISE